MRIALKSRCFAAVLVLCVSGPALALDEVTYEALVDRKAARMGENVQYLVLVHYGLDTMAPTITPPSFDRFVVLKEFQTTQDATAEAEKHLVLKKMWLLQPQEAGHLSIAASIVTYQDPTTNLLKTGKTEAQFVDVSPTAEAAPPTSPTARSDAHRAVPAWWVWAAAGLGALALFLSVTLRRRRPKTVRARFEDAALQALDQAVAHLERERPDQYYAALTRALLEYLKAKYALDAEALDTPTLLARLRELGFAPAVLQGLERFFQTAEKAKFAGFVPGEAEMLALHQFVQGFFEAGRRVAARTAAPPAHLGRRGNDEDPDA
jgi:hypothetical protein